MSQPLLLGSLDGGMAAARLARLEVDPFPGLNIDQPGGAPVPYFLRTHWLASDAAPLTLLMGTADVERFIRALSILERYAADLADPASVRAGQLTVATAAFWRRLGAEPPDELFWLQRESRTMPWVFLDLVV